MNPGNSSLRSHLQVLTMVTLLPMLVLVVVGTALIGERERAIFERSAKDRTRAVMTAIDAELRGHAARLQLLTETLEFDAANMRVLHNRIMRLLPTQVGLHRVDVADEGGRRLIDSQYPFGSQIPPVVDGESFRKALQTRKEVVSNLFMEDQFHFAIRAPVFQNGELQYVISAIVEPVVILELLQEQELPADWVGVVLDDHDRIVARTMKNDEMFGELAAPSLQDALKQAPEGWFRGVTLEGDEVYTPYLTSEFSGWSVAIGIPAEVVDSGVKQSLIIGIFAMLAALALALLLAGIVSRRISQPIASLARSAEALGKGKPVPPPDGGSVAEVHEMGIAFMEAAKAVKEREVRLREADKAKDDFLAMLGHELRNPLNALSAASQILQMPDGDKDRTGSAAAIIDRQVRHMARMLDDLLDVARVSTGKVTLDRKPVDMGRLVGRSVSDMRSAGQFVDHTVEVDAEPVWVHADAARLEQIVSNLLSNAIKYTPPARGAITVETFRMDDRAILQVTDPGIGLSAELAPRIFELFVQGEQSMDRQTGGLGIGLTLVKMLSQLHGGEVSAYSEGLGRGTRVTVSLPAIDKPADIIQGDGESAPPEGRGEAVLLVEDNPDARQTLRVLLELLGYKVFEAGDGLEGLEIARQVDPLVAIIDIGLPGIDGLEVARRLRSRSPSRPVMIAVSGYGQAKVRQSAKEAGFAAFITKPVSVDALAALIERVIRPAGAGEDQSAPN